MVSGESEVFAPVHQEGCGLSLGVNGVQRHFEFGAAHVLRCNQMSESAYLKSTFDWLVTARIETPHAAFGGRLVRMARGRNEVFPPL